MINFLASMFGRLVGSEKRKGPASRFADVSEMREQVLRLLAETGQFANLQADPDDPAVLIYGRDKSVSGKADLTNVFRYCQITPDVDVDEELAGFVRVISRDRGSENRTEENLVPSIRATEYLSALRELSEEAADLALTEPLYGDLHIVYQFDLPEALSIANSDDFPDGRTVAELRPVALHNLEAWLPEVVEELNGPMCLFFVEGNPMISPSLIRVEQFWRNLQPRYPEGALIAIPRRDQLFLFDRRDPQAETYALQIVEATRLDGFGFLSGDLFEWTGSIVRPLVAKNGG